MNDQTFEYLESLAKEHADFKAFPKTVRVRIGLERLEQYSSNLVVAWIENSPRDLLNALLKTDLYALVRDTIRYVGKAIDTEIEPGFESRWRKFESLVLTLEGSRTKRPEICFVGIFFAVVVLRNYFESHLGGNVGPEQLVQIDEDRYSPAFISPLLLRSKQLPISFNIQGRLLEKFDELPGFIDELSQWTE